MIQVRSYLTTSPACRSQPFDRTLDNHSIIAGSTPIGHVWRDHPRLPWVYLASGMFSEARTAYPDWSIARCCEAVWAWRVQGWQSDIQWRETYGLPPDPTLSRRIAYQVDFYKLTGEVRSKSRKPETFEQRSLVLA
ncbi:MAG: hypothetical protein ACRC62_37000 [Microcoleus sp.]